MGNNQEMRMFFFNIKGESLTEKIKHQRKCK